MKTSKIGLTLFALMLMQSALHAQWSTNGSSIYYNSGNVAIGTSTPSQLLQVYNPSSDAKASILTRGRCRQRRNVFHIRIAVMALRSKCRTWN